MSNRDLFKDLINQQLSSVEFVQDYLSLHFDGIILTYYLWPTVWAGREYFFDNSEYKNKLCSFIAKRIEEIIFEEESELVLKFSDDSNISVSLKRIDKNLELPEFLYYHDGGDKWFVLH